MSALQEQNTSDFDVIIAGLQFFDNNNKITRNRELKQEDNDALKKGIVRIWIIWWVMFLSLCIYVVICKLIEPTWIPLVTPDFPINTLRDVLYGASIIVLFLSDYIRKFILKSQSSTQFTRFNQLAAQTNMPASLLRYQTAVNISLAFTESIGIFGFIIFILCKDINTLYIFVGTSAAGMIYHIPRMGDIQ